MRYLFIALILISLEGHSQNTKSISKDDTSIICGAAYLSMGSSQPVLSFERTVLYIIGVDWDNSNRNKIISSFLNNNFEFLICGDDSNTKIRNREHIFKRMIAFQDFSYINHLAENEDSYTINWNLFEIIDGKKETILDYVNKIISDQELFSKYDEGGLLELRDMLIEMGVKKGSEL